MTQTYGGIKAFRDMFYKKGLWILPLFILLALPRPVLAQEQPPACTPAAKVFEKTICREEVITEKAHIEAIRQQYEEQGLDSEEALKTRSLDRMRDIIWDAALTHKFGEGALAPKPEEIEFFSTAFRASLDTGHKKNVEAAEKIKGMLALGTYEGEKERQLRSLLTQLETSIAFYEERESYKENMPPEFHQMVSEAERGLAETMMRNWKTNKALYETYGGRLAMRDGAVEPIDAFKKFLGYIRETGKLEIIDPEFKDVFREIELAASSATILPESEAALYKNYYSSPQWQFDNNANPAGAKTSAPIP